MNANETAAKIVSHVDALASLLETSSKKSLSKTKLVLDILKLSVGPLAAKYLLIITVQILIHKRLSPSAGQQLKLDF